MPPLDKKAIKKLDTICEKFGFEVVEKYVHSKKRRAPGRKRQSTAVAVFVYLLVEKERKGDTVANTCHRLIRKKPFKLPAITDAANADNWSARWETEDSKTLRRLYYKGRQLLHSGH